MKGRNETISQLNLRDEALHIYLNLRILMDLNAEALFKKAVSNCVCQKHLTFGKVS